MLRNDTKAALRNGTTNKQMWVYIQSFVSYIRAYSSILWWSGLRIVPPQYQFLQKLKRTSALQLINRTLPVNLPRSQILIPPNANMAQQIDPHQYTTPFQLTKTMHRDPYDEILPSKPSNSQNGRIVIVTGAYGGIGAVSISSCPLQI